MSGGNIDMRLLSNLILRELAREGRPCRSPSNWRTDPASLPWLLPLVGKAGGNILEVSHNRMLIGTPLKSASLGLVIEARDARYGDEIREKLLSAGLTIA